MNSPLEATPDARRDVSSAGRARAPEGTFELSRKRVDELDTIFGEGGLLARALDGYRPRTSQIEMARAVASAMEASARRMPEPEIFETRKRPARRDGDKAAETGADAAATEPDSDAGDNTLIVEAGTGTGKTYAYLVPAMLWGGKVIVSTGTKHLQDQLFQRDIPTVRNALAVPVSVAMLKGRANYLCHYYLQRTADNGRLPSRQDTAYLQEIVRFAKITKSGDKAELASVPETAPVWSMVT